ncbi:hypothetical protein DASC09_050360 [Saccharomycopsis crataegensis]|uniref:F-box domain-containing protein n=1 Tax=Saccharomycopsis crataegensis TaxID=43959 RepID=A0AAV5QT23_9ASCO|nr:hypothetical protein DASC09_050360 [Saccharomycopsis crataegensis]
MSTGLIRFPTDVLISIFRHCELSDLHVFRNALSFNHRVTTAIDTVLYNYIFLVTSSTLGENSQWADECLESQSCIINNITFKTSSYSGAHKFFGLVLLDQLPLLNGYEKYIQHLTVCCLDLSSLNLFGRAHTEALCLGELIANNGNPPKLDNGSCGMKNQQIPIAINPTSLRSSPTLDTSLSAYSHSVYQVGPNCPESLKSMQKFIDSLVRIRKIDIRCPCLRSLVKNIIKSKHKIANESSEFVAPTYTIILQSDVKKEEAMGVI